MSPKFYWTVFKRAWLDRKFRHEALLEIWIILKRRLPARLVTPRSKYIYCRIMTRPGKGRWLPPGSLRLRPSAYGLAFNEAGQVLMVNDAFTTWRLQLPGGAVEPGETLYVALNREFKEETGLNVQVGQIVYAMDDFAIMPTGEAVHGMMHFFLVKVLDGELKIDGNGFDTCHSQYVDIEKVESRQLGGENIRNIVRQGWKMHQLRLNSAETKTVL